MNLFEYLAVNANGRQVNGRINAHSESGAIKQLQAKKLYPIKIKQIGQSVQRESSFKLPRLGKLFKPRLDPAQLADFTRQFGTLIETGIPYHKALDILTPTNPKTKFDNMLANIKSKVLEGSSLHNALREHEVFDGQYLAAVAAGERTGRLGLNMLQLAEYMDNNRDLKNKVLSALIYPAIMLVLGIAILIFMVQYIIPKIVPIFSFFNHALPLPTRFLLFLSDTISSFGYIILILLLVGLLALRKFLASNRGIEIKDRWLLKIPILGQLLKQLIILRFSLSFGTLLQSGITVKEALMLSSYAANNKIFEQQLKEVQELTVSKGYTLSAALKQTDFFDPKFVQIIKVGEESGRLEEMVLKLGDNLKQETQAQIQKFVALLEPIIILCMAMMVGLIVLAILLPIFELNLLIQ